MLRYIAKRVLSAIITIWFIMTLTFILMNAIPGDPFASEKMNDPVKSRCYVSWISGRICGDRRIVRTDTAPIYKSIDVSGS